jgi:hypothetical protein
MPGGDGGNLEISLSAPIIHTAGANVSGAVCAHSGGGKGGEAGLSQNHGDRHVSEAGGDSGLITVANSSIVSSQNGAGIIASAVGGDGADGKDNNGALNGDDGGGAGRAGSARYTQVTNSGAITSHLAGISVTHVGGNGGNGGAARNDGAIFYAGQGGAGGSGGVIEVENSGTIFTLGDDGAGIAAKAYGGLGGAGGEKGTAGKGGRGGDGGGIVVVQNGIIATLGNNSAGVLAESFGGQGAPGGLGVAGGAGGTGGNGGVVIIRGGGSIMTGSAAVPQENSQGFLAQSVGGGGGPGGDTDAPAAFWEIGGNGGVSASGGPVTIDTTSDITTYGELSQAIMAQSIGGGGGNAGRAEGEGTIFNLAIGGRGGGGGDGGTLTAQSAGTLVTKGGHATGMLLQSVGGGGGTGGAAHAETDTLNLRVGIALALGGSGGDGGSGGSINMLDSEGTVSPTNSGVIWTSGAGSTAILGQSIGGGGGKGATAGTKSGGEPEHANFSLDIAAGGSGGKGGSGGTIDLANAGVILSGGYGSSGMYAQSVGGGGGDAAGTSEEHPGTAYKTWSIGILHGGTGGTAGSGGAVTLANLAGLIVTTGGDADGLVGQSVGGGGGSAKTGDGILLGGDLVDLDILGLLGAGGSDDRLGASGDGGAVALSNGSSGGVGGSIVTLGDGAAGMLAQSVGGGGGRIGGSAVNTTGAISITSHLGLSRGNGTSITDTGPAINLANYGNLVTFGADASGMIAQSIGGGGGLSGKGATSLGFDQSTGDGGNGTASADVLEELASRGPIASTYYSSPNDLLGLAENLIGERSSGASAARLAALAQSQGTATRIGSADSVAIDLKLGGSGPAVGQAGGSTVTTNAGSVATIGKMSAGLVAQSIGAGGGIAGAAVAVSSANSNSGRLVLGGSGNIDGSGGSVAVDNLASAQITTISSIAPGIIAQSIGGGGGMVGLSGSSALLSQLAGHLGASGASGDGEGVTVANAGGVETLSHDSAGIIAQSIGGGGGLIRLLTTDLEVVSGQIENSEDFTYNLQFGGTCAVICASGNAGEVSVTNKGASGIIRTWGENSYGILAQSIGGGGGAVLGGDGRTDASRFGSGILSGDGGEVRVELTGGSTIETHGDGAVGILAQSIGGGGGLLGGMSNVDLRGTTSIQNEALQHRGGAGDVNIKLESGTRIDTYGTRAHGIFAQAAGGGGGVFGSDGGSGVTMVGLYSPALSGTASANAGKVTIDADGFILARGSDSWGIWAQSRGNGNDAVEINLTKGTGVVDGQAGGIYIDNPGSDNVINNNGYISGSGSGIAIQTTGTGTLNSGFGGGIVSITGDILSTGGGWNVINNSNSRLYSGRLGQTLIQSYSFTNHGEIWIGTAADRTMRIEGDLHSDGRIVVGANFQTGKSDQLFVDGTAVIDGPILINPISLGSMPVQVIVAGTIKTNTVPEVLNFTRGSDDALTPVAPYLYDYLVHSASNRIEIRTVSKLSAMATPESGNFNVNQGELAGHLEELWNGGPSAGGTQQVSALLTKVNSAADYATALDSMGPHTLGVAAASRASADRAFTATLMSCPSFATDTVELVEQDCVWARSGGGSIDAHSNDRATGFNADSFVAQVGGQKEVGDGWFVGGSVGYETTDIDSDQGNAQIEGESLLAGLNVKRQSGRFIASVALTGGLSWFDGSRSITVVDDVSRVVASPRTKHAGGHVKLSYDLTPGRVYVRPQISLDATYVHFASFAEEGSTYGLEIESGEDWILSAAPAVEVGTKINSGSFTARPFAKVGAVFYDQRDWTVEARLAGTSDALAPFRAETALPETTAQLGAGLELVSGGGFDFRAEYSGEIGKDYDAHSGFIRVGYRF